MNKGIILKTKEEINIMVEGGKRLAETKERLREKVNVGVSAYEIEALATYMIKKLNCEPSFKMVPDYEWSTCVNVNEGIVHGIPKKEIIFKKGDLVSVDVGVYYRGFHTDTSFSKGIYLESENQRFFAAGEKALKKAIQSAQLGNRIYDISHAIETVIRKAGYSPIRALVGHGVGRELHEDPQIPCFADAKMRPFSPRIEEGLVIAIEVMYSKGSGDVSLESDGWTISSSDDTITALFEDTVAVTKKGTLVLT